VTVKQIRKLLVVFLILAGLSLSFVSCATVPKEVVELSYQMGVDLSAVHKSYKLLIHDHFDSLRAERIRYLNNEWIPKYIKAWVVNGRLLDVAKGEVVWSQEKGDFIKPIPGKEGEGFLTTVNFWSVAAVKNIEKKRAELLDPLNKQEEQLLSWVDDEFDRLYRGNATITAHLNSLRKVQEVQDDALAALHLKDLRDKINNEILTSSDKADKALEAIKKADEFVQETKEKIPKKIEKK